MRTILTEQLIMRDLEILGHGGMEAITLFLEMRKRLHQDGAKDSLQDWVTIAAPSLPEKERNEILVMLVCSHLFSRQKKSGAPPPILH